MRKLMIKWIGWYQNVTKNTTPTCKYTPTCSHYAKEAYEKRNFFVASFLTVWRILRCNPFSKGGYDPVPLKNKKGGNHLDYLSIKLFGDDGLKYSLSDFLGKKLILYIYPKDNAIDDTIISKDFTYYREDFEAKGYKIIGLSKDSVKSHKNFINKQMISNLLLSDPDLNLISKLGAVVDENGKPKVSRNTFIFDEEGKMIKTYKLVSAQGHVEQLLSEL
ncbi:MAG: membrane protein insertion efficiency factor YidD [Candidatus Izemoplasmataceae bacterium]